MQRSITATSTGAALISEHTAQHSLLPQWYTSVAFKLQRGHNNSAYFSSHMWHRSAFVFSNWCEQEGAAWACFFSPIWFGSQCYKIRSRGVWPTCNSNLSVFPWQWIDPTLFTWDKYKFGTNISLAAPASAWRMMRLIGIWGSTLIRPILVCALSKMCQTQTHKVLLMWSIFLSELESHKQWFNNMKSVRH